MAFKKYIKGILKPEVAKRAKAMKTAKRERIRASNRQIDYGELEKKIGYVFDDKSILKEALTHPGAVGFSKGKVKSNQRLEFLGDAVLQSSITDIVFRKFDTYDEGALTKIRIALTQGSFLSELSQSLEIPKYLILPKGSEHLREMASAAVAGNVAVARAINNRLMPLHQKLFCEPNPVAPKWALYRMGRIGSGIRLPLTPLSEANRPVVEKAMREAGVEF